MEATIFVNTTRKLLRAALTGTAPPEVKPRLQTHLKLTVKFFAEDEDPALLAEATTFRVVLKNKLEPSGSVLALLSAPTATGADYYEFEWASVDSAALRTLLGDAESADAVLEVEWTLNTTIERASMDVTIQNAWARTADSAPDLLAFAATITASGYLRLVDSSGTVFHIGLNTGEPPS